MRHPKFEELVGVCWANERAQLEALVAREIVELYQEEEQSGDCDGSMFDGMLRISRSSQGRTWRKEFRKDGPLEWFNNPHDLFVQIEEYVPPPPPPDPRDVLPFAGGL